MSRLAGTPAAPIIVRRYREERAILDSTVKADPRVPMRSALTVVGPHTWFWGFEITNTEPTRVFTDSFTECWERQHCRSSSVEVFGAGVKLINLVIYDTGNGPGMWKPAIGAEVYGNIVFYTGWQNEVRGNGHSLYVQNDSGTKRVVDNVLFAGFHSGVHLYGGAESSLRNVHFEGNTIFNTGLLAADPNGWGILVGGGVVAESIAIVKNFLFNPSWYQRSNNLNPSWGLGALGVLMEDNYSAGPVALGSDTSPSQLRATGNSFFGSVSPALAALVREQPNNTMGSLESMSGKPNRIFMRKNQYEPDKAIVTVFNWQATSNVALDLTAFLKTGDDYEIVDVQNYFGPPVRSGTFDGQPVSVPMVSGSGSPVGTVPGARYRTGVEFGVFQVRIRPATSTPQPKLRVVADNLRFSLRMGGSAPAAQWIFVSSLTAEPVAWEARTDEPWIRLAKPPLTGAERLSVSIDARDRTPGTYHGQILLTPQTGAVQTVPVTLTVSESGSAPVIDAVVNSASRFPALAGDTLFVIRGLNLSAGDHVALPGEPLPTELGGTRVRVAGTPAYLQAVSPTHVLAMAPLQSASGTGGVELSVETSYAIASTVVSVVPISLGLWELDSAPGHLIATHSDGRLVAETASHLPADAAAARPGDYISLYVTGLRLSESNWAEPFLAPKPAAGAVEVLFSGRPGVVTFAGLIQPGAGQVNVVVPALPPGRHQVVLRYLEAESQPSAYLPVTE